MNARGQIFTLDALVSLILVMLALGLVFALFETRTYAQQEKLVWLELESAGSSAIDQLIMTPEFTCALNHPNALTYSLPNCVIPSTVENQFQAGTLSRALGLSNQYNIQITGLTIAPLGNSPSSDVKFIYSESRRIVTMSNPTLSRTEFNSCQSQDPNCLLTPATLIVKLWRKTP